MPEQFDVEDLPTGRRWSATPQGVVYAKRAADAYYHDPVGPPLADITSRRRARPVRRAVRPLGLLLRLRRAAGGRWPSGHKQQYQSTDRAVVTLWRMHYLQAGMLMRGYEQFLIDLMVDKDLAHALLASCTRPISTASTPFWPLSATWFDVVFLTDDLGTQKGGMISAGGLREMIYPYISEAGRTRSRRRARRW